MKTVTASEANRHFSRLLREAARGETISVISRGKTVATLAPVDEQHALRQKARQALLERLKAAEATGARAWRRDELYDG